ncbi:MAG: ABC transporter permease [Promethearchaeota archaeon]|jgi:ABC-type antimicrobial peptide transport system permease subunit
MTNFKLIIRYAFLDLKNQKVRTILAIIGMLISIGLLTVILFLNDSISSSYVDFLTIEAGNQDATISVRHYTGEPDDRSSYFKFDPLVNSIQNTSKSVDNIIPRMDVSGRVMVSKGFHTTELTGDSQWSTISAINFSLENSISFGAFTDPDSNEELIINELPLDHCIIYYGFNDVIRYSVNDSIEIRMRLTHGNVTYNIIRTLTVDAIFDFNLKWPSSYRNRHLIAVDINTLYEYFGYSEFNNTCSNLILTFKESNRLYDIRDIDGTKARVKRIASSIQAEIGINEYYIDLPKLRVLGWAEMLTVLIVIVFIFVSIVSMLISGVLINGILRTSVEERIKEFGIFRTLGANKKYNLYIVLMQGFLLCNFGTLSGIVTAVIVSKFVIIPFANSVISAATIGFTELSFSFTWTSILISYSMGIGIGMVVSISPAFKVMKLQLIESIHPYRHEDTLYHLRKKATVNYKIILMGIILAFNGGFVFYIIPQLLISTDATLFAGTLISILLIFNIGLTLAGLGLIPLILRLILQVFRPISRRLHNIIKIFVFRYQRRNSSTIMIFALSFSFVVFTSSIINSLSAQSSAMTQLSTGSDLVIETSGWKEPDEIFSGGFGGGGGGLFSISEGEDLKSIDNERQISLSKILQQTVVDPNRILTTELEEELLVIDGIEKVSTVLARPYQLTQIYSEEDKEFSAEIGDYAGITTQEISLIGIDEEFTYTVKRKFIEMTSGGVDNAFNNLFNYEHEYTCIISEAISIVLNLRLGDYVRIVVRRGDELEVYPFEIVGTVKSVPGFASEFGASSTQATRGGVLISQDTYIKIVDIPPVPYIDRIFIKLREDGATSPYQIEAIINELYRVDYSYNIYNLERLISQQQSTFFILDTLFSLIAMTTVFICIFGLLSSSYSTIIERKKEIGIVRTLGLKGREINRLFIIESLVIMISSGTVGTVVGWLSAWIVTTNLATLTGQPDVIYIPTSSIVFIYLISIGMILIGMKLLLRKARKQKIVEIYRETM